MFVMQHYKFHAELSIYWLLLYILNFVFIWPGFGGLWGRFWRRRGGGGGNSWRRSSRLSRTTEERQRRSGITEQTSEVNLIESISMMIDLFGVSMFLEIIVNTTFWKKRRHLDEWGLNEAVISVHEIQEKDYFPSSIKSLKNCIVGTVWDLKDIFLDQVEHFG